MEGVTATSSEEIEEADVAVSDLPQVANLSVEAKETRAQRGMVAAMVSGTWVACALLVFGAIIWGGKKWDDMGEPFLAVTSVATGVFGFYAPRRND